MIIHRHKKLIMGGGVCLLIALTGVVATASVATAPTADTISYETRDTAEIAVSTTATIDVAPTAEQKSVDTTSRSTASSKTEHEAVKTSSKSTASNKKTASEQKAVKTSSKSTTSQKTTSEPEISDAESQTAIQETTFEPEIVDTASQATTIQETTFEPEVDETASQSDCQETTSEASTDEVNTSSAVASTTPVSSWDGPVLTSFAGIIQGPSGSETYYNLDMSGVVSIMKSMGYDYDYWVRDDGVKMYGKYVMCAADLSIRPRGSIIETSLGLGIVCDTGGFVDIDPYRLDIAVTW